MWENILSKLHEIGEKITSIAKVSVPIFALLAFFKWIFGGFVDMVTEWFNGFMTNLVAKVTTQLDVIGVDLAPGPEFQAFISKANTIVPLQELVHYVILYLGFASVVVGVKWSRNLVPGFS